MPVRVAISRGSSLRRLARNRGGILGLVFVATLLGAAVLAPYVAPATPDDVDPASRLLPPSRGHLFGTDQFGRDIFSRVIYGSRISIQVGVVAVGIGAAIGVLWGLVAGYCGGRVDMISMRLIDVLLSFPTILLALVIVAVLGPGVLNIMIAVGLSSVPEYCRVVRGSVLAHKENLYVEAARAAGVPGWLIMLRHLLPNVVAPVIVLSTLGVGRAVLMAAALSFLGLGAQPPTPEWGVMVSAGRDYLRQAWWLSTFPGLAITFTVLAVNLLGDALRDALDPRLKT